MFTLRDLHLSDILLTESHEGQLFHIPKFKNPHVKFFVLFVLCIVLIYMEPLKADVMLKIVLRCKYKE